MNKPESILDTLFIGKRLQSKIGDFSLSEIQFFAYLSCLLSLYDGHTVTEWNCPFIKSSLGSPYSSELHIALETLISNGSIIETENDYFQITEKGIKSLDFYTTLELLNWRCQYLEASCRSLSVFPYGKIKEAIVNEPVLFSARNSTVNRNLLDGNNPATEVLHTQFASLKVALADQFPSLIGPAIVWIESLNQRTSISK